MKYTFLEMPSCNMCGAESQKILGRRLNTPQGFRPKKRLGISTTVVQCSVCGLIYANPLPIPEHIEQHYGIPPEEYWQTEAFAPEPDHFQEEFAKMKSLVPGAKTYLDIGSGTGKTLLAALNNGFDAYGIEGSRAFYERAVKSVPDRISHTTIEAAEFPEGKFDVVSFGAVLEHLYDPSEAIKKALRWLSPTGVIWLEVPNAGYLYSRLMNFYFWLGRTDFVVNISPMHRPFHLYEFTEQAFRENGRRSGYEIADIEYYSGISPMSATNFMHPVVKPIMERSKTGVGMILFLKHSSNTSPS